MSDGVCRKYDDDWCEDHACGNGDGDCDGGECPNGFKCGSRNFLDYHPALSHCVSSGREVCEKIG